VEKNQETQTQIDADILQCRTDILRACQPVSSTVKEESSDSVTATTTQVKPTAKDSVKAEQGPQIQGEVKTGTADKGEEPTKNVNKSEPEPQVKTESDIPAELFGEQTQNQVEQETKVSAQKAEAEAKAAKEKAEQEAKARVEAQEKAKAEQELKTAAQMAQAESKAARIKAQAEAKAAVEKAEQEVKARIEAQEKAKTEAEARAKAEQEVKAAVKKAEQEAKALAEKASARAEPESAPAAAGPTSKDEEEKAKALVVTFQGGGGEETENRIPRFNIAQQILAEQRKAASTRRGRPIEHSGSTEPRPATGIIGQIIREVKKKSGDVSEAAEIPQQLSCGVHGIVKGAHNLSPAQQEVIASIVTLDIVRFCSDEGARRDVR
jgi:TolA protein